MRKKLAAFLLSLASVYCLNPLFAGDPANDTIIHFVRGVEEYNLVLEGREQLFEYTTIQTQTNNAVKLRIKNNSAKTIAILSVRSNASGKMLADLSEPGRNEAIKPGDSFCITLRPVDRLGPLSAWATIKYIAEKEEKELMVRVKGFIIRKPEPATKSIQAGLKRFNIDQLIAREKGKTEYSFVLRTPTESYGFPPSTPKKELVFSWDTLRTGEFSPVLFHFKNTSGYVMTILGTAEENGSVYYRSAANQVILLPDSSLTIEAIPNIFNEGHFYHSFVISYQSDAGIKQFELKQWGYIPADFGGVSAADTLLLTALRDKGFYGVKRKNQTGSIQFYVYKDGKSVSGDVHLEVFSKEGKTMIESTRDEQGNPFFPIQRNRRDTLWIQVLSPNNEVLQKGLLVIPYPYDYYGLPFFTVSGQHTYAMQKIPYQPMSGIYKLAPEDNQYRYVSPDVIKKYTASTPIVFEKNGTVRITDSLKAIALEKKLAQLSPPIRLFPVTKARGNGELTWYSNSFRIIFHKQVSVDQVVNIFAKYKITNYKRQDLDTRNTWSFSLKSSVIDRKYITLLDQLWQLKEVIGLIQEEVGTDGHD